MANIRKTFNFRNGVQVDEDNFIVDSLGKVGIGTTVPNQMIDCRGNAKVVGILTSQSLETRNVNIAGVTTISGNTHVGSAITMYPVTGIISATQIHGDGRNLINIPTSQWTDINAGLGHTSIYNEGFVGVSTNDPRFTLQVGGNNDLTTFANGVGINSSGNIVATGNGSVDLYYDNVKKFETHDVGTIFTEAGSGETQAAIKVNTTLDTYGVVTVRNVTDTNVHTSAFQVENESSGNDETNLLLRSVNLGTTQYAHGLYAAKSHRFAVSNNETPTVQVDSHGLKFNNDQAAANALDDYEEGTFTPSNAHVTLTGTEGHYTKIGDLVTVQMIMLIPSTSNTSDIEIDGLPFNAKNGSGGSYIQGGCVTYHNQDGGPYTVLLANNMNRIIVYVANGNRQTLNNFSGKNLRLMATYKVA